jgi:hypothetical protein
MTEQSYEVIIRLEETNLTPEGIRDWAERVGNQVNYGMTYDGKPMVVKAVKVIDVKELV